MIKLQTNDNFVRIFEDKRLTLSTIVLSLFLFFATPNTIYWDSFLYLGSAESLFSPTFSSQYHWLREPGYPLFIRAVSSLFGLNAVFFVQFCLNWLSVILLSSCISKFSNNYRSGVSKYYASNLAIIFGSGYAASILQQTFFVFTFSAACFITFNVRRFRSQFAYSVVLSFMAAIVSTILLACLLSLYFGMIIIALLKRENISLHLLRISIVSLIMGFVVTSSWYGFKANNDKSLRIYQDAWHFWEFEQTWANPTSNVVKNNLYRFAEMPSVLFALGQFGIETTYPTKGFVSGESQVFVAHKFTPDEYCGKKFHGPDGYITALGLSINLDCKQGLLVKINNVIRFFLTPLIPLIGLTCFFLIIIAIARQRFTAIQLSLCLSPYLSLIPYLLASTGASRYGAPVLVAAPFIIRYLMFQFNEGKSNA